MRYQGGKSRTAKHIANHINAAGGGTFVSLFCGGCAVESLVRGFDRIILNDKHPYLIALLRAVQKGFVPPDRVTEKEYYFIKEHKDLDPALAGFIGFGCSFGGKWFSCYGRSKDKKTCAEQSKDSLLRGMKTLMNAEIVCADYREVDIPPNAVVYADPPYEGTEGYKGMGRFDHSAFWEYMRHLSRQGHTVFVSSLNAPDDFKCVWQKEVFRTAGSTNNKLKAAEKLFVYSGKDSYNDD